MKDIKTYCESFHEMCYDGSGKAHVIARGRFDGFKFLVINQGGHHPCAYVDVGKTHLKGKHFGDISCIDVHGSLTFSEGEMFLTGEVGWWIGWDYAHIDDKIFYGDGDLFNSDGTEYTTEDCVFDCLKVIKQVKFYERNFK